MRIPGLPLIHCSPVLHRELLLRARSPATRWIRLGTGIFILLLAGMSLGGFNPLQSPSEQGRLFFTTLCWALAALAAFGGPWFASECLNRERREGTLGLLLLTPLRGSDIVQGKLCATSLHLCFALLVAGPALAIALPLGGVTLLQVLLTLVALFNLLFAALACSLCASLHAKSDAGATGLSYSYTLAWILIPTALQGYLHFDHLYAINPISPVRYGSNPTLDLPRYFLSLGCVHALSWGWLLLAGRSTNRLGVRSDSLQPTARKPALRRLRSTRRDRPHFNDSIPLRGLLHRRGGLRGRFWLAITIQLLSLTANLSLPRLLGAATYANAFWIISVAAHFLTLLLVAQGAATLVAETRHRGWLELILSTPLPAHSVSRSLSGAVLRALLPPLVLLGLAQSVLLTLQFQSLRGAFPLLFLLTQALALLHPLVTLVAAAWLALWLGLTLRQPSFAPYWTVVILGLLPWLFSVVLNIAHLTLFAVALSGSAPWYAWLPYLGQVLLSLAFTGLVLFWARSRFLYCFRAAATGLASWSTWLHPPRP